jgi:hypothetical protein
VQADEYWQLVHANAASASAQSEQTSDGSVDDVEEHAGAGDDADADADMDALLAAVSRHYCDQHECYYYHNAQTGDTAWNLEEVVAAPLAEMDEVEEDEEETNDADVELIAAAPIRRTSRRKSSSSEISVEGEDEDEDAAEGTPLQLHMRRKRAQTGESGKLQNSVKPLQLHLITSLATHRYNSGLATP